MNSSSQAWLECFLSGPETFIQLKMGIRLRPYQSEPLLAILESIYRHHGDTFVLIFSRQSGKDELIANLIAYLLVRFQHQEASIVCTQPTFKPQTITAMERLKARLHQPWARGIYQHAGGYIHRIGRARCTYLSAEPSASVVGATARTLLIANEAQDIDPGIYDKRFIPMASSGNATRLVSGTSWTSGTLLARELRVAQAAQGTDGRRRAFIVDGEQVGRSNPFYARHMAGQVRRFGREHPFIKTQYYCEEIEAQAGMFPPGRQALMRGSHPASTAPEPGKLYAFLLDVAGQDEARFSGAVAAGAAPPANTGRDSTVLKIVEVDLASLALQGKPTYRVRYRQSWQGLPHVRLFGALKALAETWRPRHVVIDATGVGEGLWSLLESALGANVVIPVKFSARVKSELGYGFLAILEAGRYLEYHPFDATLQMQLDMCVSEIQPGPGKLMHWGVPDGRRDPTGSPVHDDDLLAAALCAELDRLEWRVSTPPMWAPGPDPLEGLGRGY
jgi:hypothetical protein